MEKNETKQLLTLLKVAYPKTYNNMTAEEMRETLTLYFEMFKEIETVVIVAALKNYIKKNVYPPTIAGLQEQINLIQPQGLSDAEMWVLISKACQNGYYGAKEEFEKLPDDCKRWLGSPQTLKELSQVEPDKFNTVVKGQFLKTITEIKKSNEAVRSLPAEVRQAIQGTNQKLLELDN